MFTWFFRVNNFHVLVQLLVPLNREYIVNMLYMSNKESSVFHFEIQWRNDITTLFEHKKHPYIILLHPIDSRKIITKRHLYRIHSYTYYMIDIQLLPINIETRLWYKYLIYIFLDKFMSTWYLLDSFGYRAKRIVYWLTAMRFFFFFCPWTDILLRLFLYQLDIKWQPSNLF